jgi:signal transduction histidine kinase
MAPDESFGDNQNLSWNNSRSQSARVEAPMWKKVVGPIFLMAFLWLTVSGATTYYIYWLSEFNTRILKENVSSIRAGGSMQSAVWKLQAAFLDAIADTNDHDEESARREILEIEADFRDAWKLASASSTTPAEPLLLRTMESKFTEYRELVDRSLRRPHEPGRSDAALVDQSTHLARSVSTAAEEIVRINEELMSAAVLQGSQTERTYNLVRLGFLIAGPLFGIIIGLRIARNLHQSISQISVRLKDATGDLDQEIGSVQIVPHRDAEDLTVLNDQVQLVSMRIRQILLELQKARQESVRSERLAVVGELAAGVAHEIRNPLTSVKLLMQTASRADAGGIRLESRQTQVILQEILRMEETIQALLDFARPSELHRVRHDLRETLRRALNLAEGRARLEHVTIVSRLPESPNVVEGYP